MAILVVVSVDHLRDSQPSLDSLSVRGLRTYFTADESLLSTSPVLGCINLLLSRFRPLLMAFPL